MKKLQIKSGDKVDLRDFDPADTSVAPADKDACIAKMEKMTDKLGKLQELLYAEHKHKLLVVLRFSMARALAGSGLWRDRNI